MKRNERALGCVKQTMRSIVWLLYGLSWLAIGLFLGIKFPDWDRYVPGLVHRSILTHSFIPVFLLLWWQAKCISPYSPLRLLGIGYAMATAVHLSFDLFPRGWRGFALIHIPGYGWTSPLFSQAWLIISILMCLSMVAFVMRGRRELSLGIGGITGVFCFAAANEKHIAISASIALLLGIAFSWILGQTKQALAAPNTDP